MRKRSNQILIRLNDEEFSKYQMRLSRSGKTGNSFCLACLLNHPITVIENMPDILRHLKAIGNNLNQIARAANAGYHVPPITSQLQKEVDLLWRLLKP